MKDENFRPAKSEAKAVGHASEREASKGWSFSSERFALSGRQFQDSVGKLRRLRHKTEAKAVGLKEQSPLGWLSARRALLFQRDGFSLTLLASKLSLPTESLQPRASFILLAILLLILTDCRRAGQDLSDVGVDVTVNPNPPAVGEATVTLALNDANGQPITGAQVELEGNMVHAGMAATFSEPAEVAPGRYEAPLQFNMAGDWFILVKATLPDGRKLERQVDVPGVKTE